MKVLLELLGDVKQLLSALDSLDDVRPEARDALRVKLEELMVESVRLMKTDEMDDRSRREMLFQRALEAISAGRLDEAENILKAAIEKFPRDTELHNHLGLVAWEKGEMESAVGYYRNAMGAGFPDEGAVDWFDEKNRPFLRAMEGYALALYRSGRSEEALGSFEALADMNPVDYAGCRYLAGEIRHSQGRHEEAIADYEVVPSEPAVLYNLGLAYYEVGRLEDAAATLIRAFVANRHIAYALLGREYDEGQQVPGYLASVAYAEEFVDACAHLWRDEHARRFLARCFDHPLVQVHMRQCAERLIDNVMSSGAATLREESWYAQLDETNSLGSLVRRVLDHMDS